MEYHPDLENLDEDGYTQLHFDSRSNTRMAVVSEKGSCAASPPWRLIAVILGILCLVILVIAVVLGTMGEYLVEEINSNNRQFSKQLLCARHYFKGLTCIIYFNLYIIWFYLYWVGAVNAHFTYKGCERLRGYFTFPGL
ncbi:CLEC7A isoform 3 [Pongo abelii]|uniref:CLEC7A isoform 3 n=1 Tax=Pongo abelii TaxID=9601 RepID=A0A2J8RGM8_PONAB|nr:CLEC7A isoform 3 [Pongo abelii]